MTVRVWMRPSELGECGYTIDFPVDNYRRLKNGVLVLVAEDAEGHGECGRIQAERWDAVVVYEEESDESL